MKAQITREFTDRFFILFRALPRNLRLNNVLYILRMTVRIIASSA